MSILIEATDGSQIEAGFWGADISKVMLGELAPITTQQFAGYAGLTLAEVIPTLDNQQRVDLSGRVHKVRQRLDALPAKQISDQFSGQCLDELLSQVDTVDDEDSFELWSTIGAAAAPTERAYDYATNPFTVWPVGQLIDMEDVYGARHTINNGGFVVLAYRVMRGGWAGWTEDGTYQEIKDLAVSFDKALSSPE